VTVSCDTSPTFVNEHVTLKVPGTGERFVAILTGVTSIRIRMRALHVLLQCCARVEILFARGALKWILRTFWGLSSFDARFYFKFIK
jgi:hypothetical protein